MGVMLDILPRKTRFVFRCALHADALTGEPKWKVHSPGQWDIDFSSLTCPSMKSNSCNRRWEIYAGGS